MESVIPKAVLIDIQRFVTFGPKANLAASKKNSCDFLHETPAKDDQTQISEKEEMESFRCVGCKCNWMNKSCVVKHVISNHIVYFCLNCEDWVKDKSKVLDNYWTMFDGSGNLRYDV